MRYVVLLSLFAILSCSEQRAVEKPPLGEKKMVAVLVDVHLLEAQNQSTPQRDKGRIYKSIVGYEKIFQRNGVTAEQFYDSFEYYKAHPKEMDELYQHVIDEVTRRESEISTQAAKERKERSDKPDSARKTITPHANEW